MKTYTVHTVPFMYKLASIYHSDMVDVWRKVTGYKKSVITTHQKLTIMFVWLFWLLALIESEITTLP